MRTYGQGTARWGRRLCLLVVMAVAVSASRGFGEETWRFVVTGDSRGSGLVQVNSNALREVAVAMAADRPDLVLFPGDLVNGYPTADASAFLEWKAAMAPLYDAGVKVYPVRGNHDLGDGWATVIAPDLPTNGPLGELGVTYAVTNRNALFLGLDQYTPVHQVNQPWIDAQLASNTLPHVFTFGHDPAFKVYHWDCLDDYPAQRDAFWRSMRDGGSRVYFCGHDHFFDHARLDDGDGNPANDLHQYIVGTAGAPSYSLSPYNGANGEWTPVRHYFEVNYGYCLVTIDGTRVTLQWKRRAAPGVYEVGETFTYDLDQAEPDRRYVSPGGNHETPFTSWETAATNIQAAIDVSVDHDVVLVSNGVYDAGGRLAAGGVTNRIAVEGYITVRGVGDSSNVVVVGSGPCGTGAVRCAYLGAHAVLEGVTLSNGHTRTEGDLARELSGGGVWCALGATVVDCVIVGNEAHGLGGGAYAVNGSALANCVIAGNRAQHGGGLFLNAGGQVVHSTITRNHATAVLYGGGGGVAAYEGNSALMNCIIHGNTGSAANWFKTGTGVSFLYCCTVPSPSASCITNLPLFVDAPGGDFRLTPDSACVDRAVVVQGLSPHDLLGVKRPLDGNNDGHAAGDLGAYETVHDQGDTDGDNLLDTEELAVYGTDPTRADTDRDGSTDGHEIAAGTDPRDGKSLFRIISVESGLSNSVVTWDAVTNRVYAVYGAVGINLGGWSNVGQRTGIDGRMSYTNSAQPSLRFFRVGAKKE